LVASPKALEAGVEALAATVNDTHQQLMRLVELPWILGNSRAGDRGTLYNPIVMEQGYALSPLTEPNPRNREELLNFTGEFQAGVQIECYPFLITSPLLAVSVSLQLRVWDSLLCHRISLFMIDEDRLLDDLG